MPQYWLIKSEPSIYSINDLARDGQTHWDGVRNYQARNFLRDDFQVGDEVLFYHSNSEPPAVVGLARVCRAGYPDHTAYDPSNAHHDPKATPEKPLWVMVDIAFIEKFPHPVSLAVLREDPTLDGLLLTRKGSRLSILPLAETHFRHICGLCR